MTKSTAIAKSIACMVVCITLLITSATSYAQTVAPTLGTASTYGGFSGAGAIENTGLTIITGDIGTYVGSFTGFPPGLYTGAKHVADPAALAAKNDLILAYNSLNDATHAVMYDTALGSSMGNGQVLTPRTYGRNDLTTIAGNLTFDAQGNAAAIFIVKIRAALNVAKNTQILLANGAQAANIYWAVDGAVSILDNSTYKGTILSNGAIHLYGGSSLEGRALAMIGAVTFASNMVAVPGAGAAPVNNLVVITPAPGDSVMGGSKNYQITWGGTGIGDTKKFEYSLDSGKTWTLIGTATTTPLTDYAYSWNVPDTVSKKAFVRITDQNNLSGTSGLFSITSSKQSAGSIIVVRPMAGETISGGMNNYPIVFTSLNTTVGKTLDYSLDGGTTWTLIGLTNDSANYVWASVPNVATTQALVRIKDGNGVTGTSGMFTITFTPGAGSINSVNLTGLDNKNNITNNALLGIGWTFTPDVGTSFEVEYSLDGMITWGHIATIQASEAPSTMWTTPKTGTYAPVYIRVTGSKGMSAISNPFTISTVASVSNGAGVGGYSVSTYPNPANSQATVNFVIPISSDVALNFVDELGRNAGSFAARRYDAGTHTITVNTSAMAPGVYTYMLQAGTIEFSGRMTVVR